MTFALLDQRVLRDHPLPSSQPEGGKEGRGALLVVAGGAGVPGAAILTGLAGLRVGAGKLQLATIASLAGGLGIAVPEAQIISVPASQDGEIALSARDDLARFATKADALVIGPGMLDEQSASQLALDVVSAAGVPAVLDAAAMVGLKDRSPSRPAGPVVLTPHRGEMAALMQVSIEDVTANPGKYALEAAARFGAVVALKAADTVIVTPDGEGWLHKGGVPGLGTSGSGDVLAGVIGGLLARGAAPLVAALWGVRLHALAGETASETIGPLGFLARDLLTLLPRCLERL